MIQFIPVTISVFGMTIKFILPSSKVTTFIFGILFWIFFGPLVRWAVKRTVNLIKSQNRGYIT